MSIPENELSPQLRAQLFYRALFQLSPRAYATPLLIGANVAVFVVMAISGVHVLSPQTAAVLAWGANFGPLTQNGQWWRLFTCMFLHFGLIHIAVNMWALWVGGRFVERLLGSAGFVIMYLASGLAGSLASLYWNPEAVSAGASGAVFGVFGALLGFVLRAHRSIPREVFLGLRNNVLQFLALNIVLGASIAKIDLAAHLGGFAAGCLCGYLMGQPLDELTPARRLGRNVAALLMSCVLLAIGVKFLPPAPADLEAELQRFSQVERATLNRFNDSLEQARDGKLTDPQLADEIESSVLPP